MAPTYRFTCPAPFLTALGQASYGWAGIEGQLVSTIVELDHGYTAEFRNASPPKTATDIANDYQSHVVDKLDGSLKERADALLARVREFEITHGELVRASPFSGSNGEYLGLTMDNGSWNFNTDKLEAFAAELDKACVEGVALFYQLPSVRERTSTT